MTFHETNCNKNPQNNRACFDCIHLKETKIEYYSEFSEHERFAKSFRCEKLNKILYPFKVERMGLNKKYPETFEGQEPMPKECKLFEYYF